MLEYILASRQSLSEPKYGNSNGGKTNLYAKWSCRHVLLLVALPGQLFCVDFNSFAHQLRAKFLKFRDIT